MSPLGKWLLEHCDNNLHIDLTLGSPLRGALLDAGFTYTRARATCLMLGISLEGGS
jgi:hypothetical protein